MSASFSLPCPATQLPKLADLTNIFNELAQLPSNLIALAGRLAYTIGKEAVTELYNQAQNIKEVLDGIIDLISAFVPDIPDPLFGDLNMPQFEWEKRIQALIQNFHMFLQKTLLSIIDKVLPVNFTINVLGLAIDVLALLGNPAAIFKGIKDQISENIDQFFNLLPDAYKWFCGLLEFDVPTLKLQAVLDYIMSKLNGGLLTLLFDSFAGLIKKFKTIWDLLKLPPLPVFIDLNIESIVGAIVQQALSLVDSAISAATALAAGAADAAEQIAAATKKAYKLGKELIMNGLKALSFSLPVIGTFDVLSMIGGEITEYIESIEKQLYRMVQALRDFSFNGPKMILLDWMGKVTAFFNAIGLGALVQWISFDFCKFLKLFGFPTSISVDVSNLDMSNKPSLVPV